MREGEGKGGEGRGKGGGNKRERKREQEKRRHRCGVRNGEMDDKKERTRVERSENSVITKHTKQRY